MKPTGTAPISHGLSPTGVARAAAARVARTDPRCDPAVAVRSARLDWATALPSAAAPGFVYLAGAVRRASRSAAAGATSPRPRAGSPARRARSRRSAASRPRPADLAAPTRACARSGATGPRSRALDLVRGERRRRADGGDLPRDPRPPPGAPAAQPRPRRRARPRTRARLAALLELVERDAAAAWWSGETRPRALDLAESRRRRRRSRGAARRRRRAARATTLLALPSPTGLPVVCALSRDAAGGGLAFGLKAALDPARAIAGRGDRAAADGDRARDRAAARRPGPGDAPGRRSRSATPRSTPTPSPPSRRCRRLAERRALDRGFGRARRASRGARPRRPRRRPRRAAGRPRGRQGLRPGTAADARPAGGGRGPAPRARRRR